ncbi:MAG TPA: hypothetical protein VJC37_06995, partial [Planctomycetota bacterium]|nr:hypothetical protein [Planctomycetota bacterium]
ILARSGRLSGHRPLTMLSYNITGLSRDVKENLYNSGAWPKPENTRIKIIYDFSLHYIRLSLISAK